MSRTILPLKDRIDLVQQTDVAVTLDGKPAVIAGYRNDFAGVHTLDGKTRVEFAWPTVWRIVTQREGRFQS